MLDRGLSPHSRSALRFAPGDRFLVVIFGILFLLFFSADKGTGYDNIFYYSYLSSPVFDGDLDLTNDLASTNGSGPVARGFLYNLNSLGYPTNYFPIGTPILWSPFYLPVRAVAVVVQLVSRHAPAWTSDRFSQPYLTAVSLGSAVYGLLALLLCYRIARYFAGERVSRHAALLAICATPLLYYSFQNPMMSHACSAFMVSCVIYFTIRRRHSRSGWDWALIGAMIGGAALVRWQDVLVGFVPIVIVLSRQMTRSPVSRRLSLALVMTAVALAVFSVQLFYWRAYYGNFFANPQSSVMLWRRPEIVWVLFSGWYGLFYWHPALLIVVAGLGALVWTSHRRSLPTSMLIVLAATVYVGSCVSDWYGGMGFGGRKFASLAPIYAIGFAVALRALSRRFPRFPVAIITTVFVGWNIVLMVGFERGIFRPYFVSELLPVLPHIAKQLWRFIVLLPSDGGTLVSRIVFEHKPVAGIAVAVIGVALLAGSVWVAYLLARIRSKTVVAVAVFGAIILDCMLVLMALPPSPAGQHFAAMLPQSGVMTRHEWRADQGDPPLGYLLYDLQCTTDTLRHRELLADIRVRNQKLGAELVYELPPSDLRNELWPEAQKAFRPGPPRAHGPVQAWANEDGSRFLSRAAWPRAATPTNVQFLDYLSAVYRAYGKPNRAAEVDQVSKAVRKARRDTADRVCPTLGKWKDNYMVLYQSDL